MKKIYWVVLLTFMTTLFFYLGQVISETYALSIPNAKSLIEVTDWDKTHSSKAIYQQLEIETQKQGINLYKVAFSTSSDGTPAKMIYAFSPNPERDKLLVMEETELKNSEDLTIENPLGSYYLLEEVSDELRQVFEELGLTITVEKNMLKAVFFQFFSSEIGYSLVFLLLIILIIDVFVFVSQSKKLGILQLYGINKYRLLVPSLVKEFAFVCLVVLISASLLPLAINVFLLVGLVLFLFLVLIHLMSLHITDVSSSLLEKLKEKRPYQRLLFFHILVKMLVLGVCSFAIFQGGKDLLELRVVEEHLRIWQILPNYTTLPFSAQTSLILPPNSPKEDLERSEKQSRKIVSDLLEIGEEEGQGIFAKSSIISPLVAQDKSPTYSYMIVNHRFLDKIEVYSNSGDVVKGLKQNEFYLIIPENLFSYKEEIEQTMREIISLYQDISVSKGTVYEGTVNVLTSKPHQEIFNFNVEDLTDTMISNPVMLIAPLSAFGEQSDYLVADMSQGYYLFGETEPVATYLMEHHLTDEFAGLVSSRELGLSQLKKVQQKLYLKVIAIVASILIFAIINYFLVMTYIETQKKKLVLGYLFGKTFVERHYALGVTLGAVSLLTLLVVYIMALTTLPISLSVLSVDLIMCFGLLYDFEGRERLAVLKKGD